MACYRLSAEKKERLLIGWGGGSRYLRLLCGRIQKYTHGTEDYKGSLVLFVDYFFGCIFLQLCRLGRVGNDL
jgi:hypothetical protein